LRARHHEDARLSVVSEDALFANLHEAHAALLVQLDDGELGIRLRAINAQDAGRVGLLVNI
jgi:hypothetical protein